MQKLLKRGEQFFKQGLQQKEAGFYLEALESFEKALELFTEIKAESRKSDILNSIEEIKQTAGEYISGLGLLFGNLALVHVDLEHYREALALFPKAFDLIKNSNSDVSYGFLFNRIGLAQRAMKDYEAARESWRRSYEIFRKHGRKHEIETTSYNLGVACYHLLRLDEANYYLSESLQICRQERLERQRGWTLSALGLVYERMGKLENCQNSFEGAIKALMSVNDFEGLCVTYFNLGRVLEDHLFEINRAIPAYKHAIKNVMKLGTGPAIRDRVSFKEDKMRAFDRIVAIYAIKGDFAEAFYYVELSKSRTFIDLMLDNGVALRVSEAYEERELRLFQSDYIYELLRRSS